MRKLEWSVMLCGRRSQQGSRSVSTLRSLTATLRHWPKLYPNIDVVEKSCFDELCTKDNMLLFVPMMYMRFDLMQGANETRVYGIDERHELRRRSDDYRQFGLPCNLTNNSTAPLVVRLEI